MKTKRAYTEVVKRPCNYWKPKGFKHYKSLKELAVALGKDPSWILKLERRGTLPKPPTVKRGQLHIRFYSPEMEEEIKEIFKTIKPGNPGFRRG